MPDPSEAERIASVRVDRDLCQTAATCLAFNVYELDDEAKAVLLTKNGRNSDDPGNPLTNSTGEVLVDDLLNEDGKTRQEMQEVLLESAKACPFNAIIVTDDNGNQVWPIP